MPLVETLPVTPGTAQWSVWSTTARLVVTDPEALPAARRIVEAHLAAVELACSRFRPDSELQEVHRARGRTVEVSPLLADLVATALGAAQRTDGDVDPTVGGWLDALGYDRDFGELRPAAERQPANESGGPVIVIHARPDWRAVRLDGRDLTLPDKVRLDLGATAKAYTADAAAAEVASSLAVGVLVSLGGDIATAGPAPDGGWRVLVQDGPGDPQCTVTLPAGSAVATSSTVSRRWSSGGHTLHHIVDPRTGRPAVPVWRTATAAAARCVDANTATTAALVRGSGAVSWLRRTGLPARLVGADLRVVTLGGWPAPAQRTPDDEARAEQASAERAAEDHASTKTRAPVYVDPR
jgi:thiamine biosynthesis lipoprotein